MLILAGNNNHGTRVTRVSLKVIKMILWQFVLLLLILGIVSGHVTHIVVTGVIFEGTRNKVAELAQTRGGFWAWFNEGFQCQLCSGVWYSSVITLWWTIGLYILRPGLWNAIAGRPLGWLNVPAWISLFIVQMFFVAAVGHLFREYVGLLEDERTRDEEEAEVLQHTIRRMAG